MSTLLVVLGVALLGAVLVLPLLGLALFLEAVLTEDY